MVAICESTRLAPALHQIGAVMYVKKTSSSVFGVLLVLSALYTIVGCGHKPDLPPIAEVTGSVTLDGRPLPSGVVQFVPDESKGTKGPPGVGYIDNDGSFEIVTAGVAGALVGHHKIKLHAEEGDSPPRSLVPRRYNNEKTSGFTAEVKADISNEVLLKLTSRR